jgi:hypothetical protein
MRSALFSLLLIALPAVCGFCDSLTIQPGPAEGKDTYICDCLPNVNNPNGPTNVLYQGQYGQCFDRLLIQFDLSSLPAGATIDSAFLNLRYMSLYGSLSGQMAYYRITEDWNETTVTFSTQPDTSHDFEFLTDWPIAGTQWYEVNITPLVQAWFTGSVPNYGLYGFAVNTTGTCCAEFRSSDYSSSVYRPKLVIYYTPINEVKEGWLIVPDGFYLSPISPNPFNSSAQISYTLEQTGEVSLKVFNLLKQEVAVLVDERQSAGEHRIQWDAKDIPSGFYIIRLKFENKEATQKVELIK